MSIVVTAPTGNIGSKLVSHLLEAGADLTLLVRNPDRLSPDVRSRVKVEQGELQDADFVRRATEGADALFWVTPSDFLTTDLNGWFDGIGASASGAITANRIPYVVNVSSAGAHLPNVGPVSGLGRIEAQLNQTEADVVHLRPGYFFENLLIQLEAIRHEGNFYSAARGDVAYPIIATRDIASAAARLLLSDRRTGKSILGLHGPKDISFNQMAVELSETLGRPIQFVRVSEEQSRQAFLSMGMGAAFTEGYVDLFVNLFQEGALQEARTPDTTTPTTLASWAQENLRPLLEAAAR